MKLTVQYQTKLLRHQKKQVLRGHPRRSRQQTVPRLQVPQLQQDHLETVGDQGAARRERQVIARHHQARGDHLREVPSRRSLLQSQHSRQSRHSLLQNQHSHQNPSMCTIGSRNIRKGRSGLIHLTTSKNLYIEGIRVGKKLKETRMSIY